MVNGHYSSNHPLAPFVAMNPKLLVTLVVLLTASLTLAEEGGFSFATGERGVVQLTDGDQPVWQYNAELVVHPKVPAKDPRFLAGSYVHPLYGLHGEILTDNAPRDHYHHHGVFWNWPHVNVHRKDGTVEKYDTWTSNTRMKQLFVRFHGSRVEQGKAVFKVENGWFIAEKTNEFKWDETGRPTDEKIATEFVTITTHPVKTDGALRSRAVDFDFEWIVGDFPVSLQGAGGKSYGGLTVRFRPSTDKPGGASTITTSDGVAKEDLPDIPLVWADYTSRFEKDDQGKLTPRRTGAAVFVPKTHPDFPPTWLIRYYGPLCVGWPGVKERKFEPGETIRLSYRIWIHDAPVDVETLQKAYQEY